MRPLVILGALLAYGYGSSLSDRPARSLPIRLPPPEKPTLPSFFRPVGGSRRIFESRTVPSDGLAPPGATCYFPAISPIPWKVWAWYEPEHNAHVIEVEAHPDLRKPGALQVKVYVGGYHQANRNEFRRDKKALYPDDKHENRIVYRTSTRPPGLCFLIDVTAYDLHMDFFHEPFMPAAPAITDNTQVVVDPFAKIREIEEVEKRYAEEVEKLEQRSDLSAVVKSEMEGHLLRIYERSVKQIIGSGAKD